MQKHSLRIFEGDSTTLTVDAQVGGCFKSKKKKKIFQLVPSQECGSSEANCEEYTFIANLLGNAITWANVFRVADRLRVSRGGQVRSIVAPHANVLIYCYFQLSLFLRLKVGNESDSPAQRGSYLLTTLFESFCWFYAKKCHFVVFFFFRNQNI